MLWLLIFFIVFCLGVDRYAFLELKKCENKVGETLKKTVNRIVIKVQLEKRIIEIQGFLFFGFVVAAVVLFMWWSELSWYVYVKFWYYLVSAGLILVPILFGLLFHRSIKIFEKVDKL